MTFRRRRRLTDRDLIAARPTDRIPKGQPMTDAPATLKDPKPDHDPNRFVRVDEQDATLTDAAPIIANMVRTKVGRQALAEAVAASIDDGDVRGGTLKVAARWLRSLAVGEKR